MIKKLWILVGLSLYGWHISASEKGTADFYQSAPHQFLGKEIQLRVASVTPVPELTAADQGFVWLEAVTGRPKKEEGKILLRVPAVDSAKLAKFMNLPSSSGRWLKGTFAGHESGAVLPSMIKQKAPYYIQVASGGVQKDVAAFEDLETASGALVINPKPKEPKTQNIAVADASSPALETSPPTKKDPEGPQAVLFRAKPGESLQLRAAQSVKFKDDFCEIIGQDGKMSLVGKSLVAAVLPLPKDGTAPTKEEAEKALRLYAEKMQAIPEAAPLLAEPKVFWDKFASATMASAPLPELEDVETAAGVEEPLAESGYPAWFVWASVLGGLLVANLGWIWSRPRSTPA